MKSATMCLSRSTAEAVDELLVFLSIVVVLKTLLKMTPEVWKKCEELDEDEAEFDEAVPDCRYRKSKTKCQG
jgi:hypothetical protein